MVQVPIYLGKVREIEQTHPQDLILATVKGLEDLSVEEATNILKEIFPVVKKIVKKLRKG